MKLFIFRANWDYCGGAIVVIADSFENAIGLTKNTLDSRNSFHQEQVKEGEGGNYFPWILVESINVSENETPRVVCCEYNYA